MSIYTNSNSRRDFIRNALTGDLRSEEPVFVASAFFTEYEVLRDIAEKCHRVRLVVRLGFPTSPDALESALGNPKVDVRYFTGQSFHSKLYIFGNRVGFVGSANLTGSACVSNQEILVGIPSEDPRLSELASLFLEYWAQASVLAHDVLAKYRKIYEFHRKIAKEIDEIDSKVKSSIGSSVFNNIERPGSGKKSKENIFVDAYRKTYQESVSAFNEIRSAYEQFGRRKVDESRIPLRLEIDSFFSYVRDYLAKGETWGDTPVGATSENRSALLSAIRDWHSIAWPHLESTIVNETYPRLLKTFASPEAITKSSDDDLFDSLLTLHSFKDSLRFHRGGLVGLKSAFLGANEPARVRASLAYLVHGKGDLVQRMADLIFAPDYKLNVFGIANVQELVGWCNNKDLPVLNGRTTKILRFFGFDVQQV